MEVINFHIHPGLVKNLTPWVKTFFREKNPGDFDRLADGLAPEEVVAFFASQGVTQAVMLAEYAPKCTGVVSNQEVSRFFRDHEERVPFAALCLEDGTLYELQAQHAVEDLGMKGFKLLPSYQHFYPNDPSFSPFTNTFSRRDCRSCFTPVRRSSGERGSSTPIRCCWAEENLPDRTSKQDQDVFEAGQEGNGQEKRTLLSFHGWG